ncbi:MAG TPA: type 4a pilus biogenesis protein PilO [Solirubrobacterales bacterium]|nr:type 4a pilus biogenesis protein PilO [Solirubrobacterales bacterium]
MRGADRTILLALPLLALAIGFYLLVLAPKQREAGELQDRIDSLNAEVAAAQSDIDAAEEARAAFAGNYADIVKLGTAVPEDDDQATLIHDLNRMGIENSLDFQAFEIAAEAATATPTSTPTETDTESSTESTDGESSESSTTTEETATPVAAVPTEAAAATLPIGATVGPAGLPVTPYSLTYFGRFFDMAGLFGSLDSRVEVSDDGTSPVAHGRLMTVDGFSMAADPVKGFPSVATEIAVTTYMVPADQGLAAGATPAGPAPLGSPEAPVTIESTISTTPPTAAVTP